MLSDERLIFQELQPIMVKGKSDPVEVFRAHAHSKDGGDGGNWTV
jgi:class 3 adenylate cyclase